MKIFKKILALLLLAMTCSFANWTGSISVPKNTREIEGLMYYVITSADELAWFAIQVNNGKKDINAVLANDIVFGTSKSSRSTVEWKPIGDPSGFYKPSFDGILDGAGYTIYGLNLGYGYLRQSVGLIGQLSRNGVVKNLKMSHGGFSKSGSNRCPSDGSEYVGNFVGLNEGVVQNVKNENYISISADIPLTHYCGGFYLGGIVGYNKGGSILDCDNGAGISTENWLVGVYAGGITGYNGGVISNCNNKGKVFISARGVLESSEGYAGGIAGDNVGKILDSFNDGKIFSLASVDEKSETYRYTNKVYSGGIAGDNSGTISKCGNRGGVESELYNYYTYIHLYTLSGGISAENTGLISNCFNFGAINSYVEEDDNKTCGIDEFGAAGITKNDKNGAVDNSVNMGAVTSAWAKKSGQILRSNEYLYHYYESYNEAFGVDHSPCVYRIACSDCRKSSSCRYSYMLTDCKENSNVDRMVWSLNTNGGTDSNSGIWTRDADGCPAFANDDELAIHRIVFCSDGDTVVRYTDYQGAVDFPENPKPAEGNLFYGWYDAEDVKVKTTTKFVTDQVINAVFIDTSDVYYTIRFFDSDSTLLDSFPIPPGKMITYDKGLPNKEGTKKFSYDFKCWNDELSIAEKNIDYYAVYDSTIKSYVVTFVDENGMEIQSNLVEYGVKPAVPANPTRASTARNTFNFTGWNPAVAAVSGDVTYTATYDSTTRTYKVVFMDEDGSVIETIAVEYGKNPTPPADPIRAATVQYSYTFAGWSPEISVVEGDAAYKATYNNVLNTYKVTFLNYDKTVLKFQTVNYGESASAPTAPIRDGYKFIGWDKNFDKIISDLNVTAQFEKNSSSSVKSSSSIAKSSSSSAKFSSSSIENSDAIIASNIPIFRVSVVKRNVQITNAKIGMVFIAFDMQGRIVLSQIVDAANFAVSLPQAGNYIISIGDTRKVVQVK